MAERTSSLVERLFFDQRQALKDFFRRRPSVQADAPDLVQEAYLRMLSISNHEALRDPVRYLYTVANNLVKEHAVLDRRPLNVVDIDAAPAHERLETLPQLDGELAFEQRAARLRVVLERLRPRWRAAVALRLGHGLAYREIAIRLGVSPQMVKKYAAQALSQCRRRMARLG